MGKWTNVPPNKGPFQRELFIFQPLTFSGCEFLGRKQNGYAIDLFCTWLMLTRQWEKNTVATTNPATTQQQHCEYRFQTRLLESLSVVFGLKNFSLRNSWIKDQICLSFLFLKFRTGGFSASLMVGTAPVGMGWDYQAYNVDSTPYNTCGLSRMVCKLWKKDKKRFHTKLDLGSLVGGWTKPFWKKNTSQIGSMFPSRFENKTPLKAPPWILLVCFWSASTPHAISSTQILSYTTHWAKPFVFPLPRSFSTHHRHFRRASICLAVISLASPSAHGRTRAQTCIPSGSLWWWRMPILSVSTNWTPSFSCTKIVWFAHFAKPSHSWSRAFIIF